MVILQSKLLLEHEPLIHGISTKAGGVPPFYNNLSRHTGDEETKVNENRSRFFGSLGIDQKRLVHANQVHSNNVRIVSEPGLYKETDGLITAEKNLFLVISVADCMPVMIYDRRNRVASNIHAGWRGTQKKILTRAMEILVTDLNSKPEDILVFMGPCISPKNFEVGEEVAVLFDSKFVFRNNGKFYVDLMSDNAEQVKSFGIKERNIEMNGLCTYNEAEVLHSYRRDGERSGRMFAVIGMKPFSS